MTPRSRSGRVSTALKTAAVALASAYAFYLVATNVFLSTSLFEKTVNGRGDVVMIQYERAWSVFPGRVHVRKAWIRSGDSTVQWLLTVDRGAFDVSFFDAVVKRKLRITHVDATGVSFRARRRIEAPLATPDYVAALAPIPGFARIPIRPLAPPDLAERWDDRYYHLITVELAGVVARDVRELWVDTVRLRGHLDVKGGFFLKPIRRLEVGPADVQLDDVNATIGEATVAEHISGSATLHLTPMDPRFVRGGEFLAFANVTTELRGEIPDLARLPYSLTAPMRPSGPVLVKRLAVRIDQGRLVAPSRVEATLPALAIEIARHRFTGAIEATGDVAGAGSSPRLTFEVLGRTMEWARLSPDARLVGRVGLAHASGDARELAVLRPLRDLHAVVQVEDAVLPDARALGAYLAPGGAIAFAGGDGRCRGRLEAWFADKRLKAEAALASEHFDLRIAGTRVRGEASLDASVDAWRWEHKRIEGARVAIRAVQGAISSSARADRFILDVRGRGVVVKSPTIDLSDPMSALSAQLDMAEGGAVDLRLRRDRRASDARPELTAAHARGAIRGDLEIVDGRAKGSAELHAEDAGLTLGPLAITLRADARGRVHDWDLARGELVVDEVSVEATGLAGRLSGRGGPPAVAVSRVSVRGKSPRFSLSEPSGRLDVAARVTGGRVADAAAFDVLLPAGSTVRLDARGGRFAGAMNAVVERRIARGRGDATAHGLGFALGEPGRRVGVRGGDVELAASASRWDLAAGRLSLDELRLVVDRLEVRFDEERGPAIVARRVVLDAAAPAMDLARPSLRGVDLRLVVPETTMADARTLNRFFGPEAPIESGRARGSVDVTLSSSARRGEGQISLAIDNGGVRTGGTRIAGNVEAVVRVHGYYPERRIVDLAGSRILLREVWSTGAMAQTAHWDGDFEFLSGELSNAGAPRFDGLVQFHADDAAPVLALAFGQDLPGFLVSPLRAPGLSGQGHLTLGKGLVAITGGHVSGGNVDARGDVMRHAGDTRGAMTVAKGPLSAGLRIGADGTFVKFWGLETWARMEKRKVLAAKAGAQAEAEAEVKAAAKAKSDADAKTKEEKSSADRLRSTPGAGATP